MARAETPTKLPLDPRARWTTERRAALSEKMRGRRRTASSIQKQIAAIEARWEGQPRRWYTAKYVMVPGVRGYQYEHRVIWEEAHGTIPIGYVVHHRNGDGHDNRLENLELQPRGQHTITHHRGRKATQEQRAAMSAAHRGRPKSEKHRLALRQAMLAFWEKRHAAC